MDYSSPLPPYEDDDQALAELLIRIGILFPLDAHDWEGNNVTGIYVNANDVFWWGTADVEPLATDEIMDFYNMVREQPYGSIKWLCLKRGMRPQHPWEDQLKKEGYWDAQLEALPERGDTG